MKRINGTELMSDFNFTSKYAKYDSSKKRRELWEETIDRMLNMHFEFYSNKSDEVKAEIKVAFDMVKDKKVLASQRAMQFGGDPVLKKNMRIYNCSTSHIDRLRFFAEAFYLLLCGAGVGYSVQHRHIERLPRLIDVEELTHDKKSFVVPDSIEGWCDAAHALISSFFQGNEHSGIRYEFDYSQVRPEGAPLSHGGKAPGPEGLKAALKKIRKILLQRVEHGLLKLRPIDAYDITCHLSDAVLSGGVRRSASICLFDIDDEDMIKAKTGNWHKDNPQRARSNNSAVIIKGSISRERFHMMIDTIRQFGEPGFIFVDHRDYVYNPCAEIGMCPVAVYRPTDKERIEKLPEKYKEYCKTSKGFKGPLVENYTHELLDEREKFERYGFRYESGWQTCNLTEINCKAIESVEDYKKAVKAATIIGTCQAGFVDPGYLLKETQDIIERESLLGVSMTGVQDSPDVILNAEVQNEMAKYAIEVNKDFAKKLGINTAARITCVKPAGNSSVLLECASGIHPHHARRYFRRMQVNKNDNVLEHFSSLNPHAIEHCSWSSNGTDDIITFPIDVGARANTYEKLKAVEFLDHVRLTQENWVSTGTAKPNSTQGLFHNVSNTVKVRDTEWGDVADYLYDHQFSFSGISLLSNSGDKVYQQAPMETCWFESDLIKMFGEAKVKRAKMLHNKLVKKFSATSVQEVRYKIVSLCRLNGSYMRKYDWIKENCQPLIDEDTGDIVEPKYEFESRCDNEYVIACAIYNDIKKHFKDMLGDDLPTNINSVMDLIASVKDEEKWNNLVKKFKKVDYSTLEEEDDNTDLAGEVACAGGQCEVSFDIPDEEKEKELASQT
jgi:ribonucleoside-diphosphate reductase alpha chain